MKRVLAADVEVQLFCALTLRAKEACLILIKLRELLGIEAGGPFRLKQCNPSPIGEFAESGISTEGILGIHLAAGSFCSFFDIAELGT